MKPSNELLALTGLSEIMIENLGGISVELENQMRRERLYNHKPKQLHKKIKALHTKLSDELNANVHDAKSPDFIELCDFIMNVTMMCVAIPEDKRIIALSTLKTLNKIK